MSYRTKRIIIVGVIIAVVILLILVILGWQRGAPQATPSGSQGSVLPQENQGGLPRVVGQGTGGGLVTGKAEAETLTAEAMARSFVERFGSYSNQGNFENITDLYSFMTDEMRAWAEDFVVAQRAKMQAGAAYFGITTRAISSKVTEKSRDAVAILVTSSRRESTGAEINAKVYRQDMRVDLVKDNGIWKVDGAKWGESAR